MAFRASRAHFVTFSVPVGFATWYCGIATWYCGIPTWYFILQRGILFCNVVFYFATWYFILQRGILFSNVVFWYFNVVFWYFNVVLWYSNAVFYFEMVDDVFANTYLGGTSVFPRRLKTY
jgi:hypothetical protein